MRINLTQNIYRNPQRNELISFKGDHDILIIDDSFKKISNKEKELKIVLGEDNLQQYKIYKAEDLKEAVKLAKIHKPLFAISDFKMFNAAPISLIHMFDSIKKAGSKVIIYSSNWHDIPNSAIRKAGVETCEDLYGVFKFIDEYDEVTLETTVNALTKRKPVPRYNFQNDEDQWKYFKELSLKAESNEEIKMELAKRLDCIPAQYTNEEAKKLIFNSDNEVKMIIVDKLEYLSEENQISVAETLILNSDDEIKTDIVYTLKDLSEKSQAPVAKILIHNSDDEVKKTVAHNLRNLSEESQVPVAETLILNSNNEVKTIIAKRFYELSEENQVPVAEMLIENSDNEVKFALIHKLHYLSVKNQLFIVEKLIQNSDDEIKRAVNNCFGYLPAESRLAIKKMLDENPPSSSPDEYDIEQNKSPQSFLKNFIIRHFITNK